MSVRGFARGAWDYTAPRPGVATLGAYLASGIAASVAAHFAGDRALAAGRARDGLGAGVLLGVLIGVGWQAAYRRDLVDRLRWPAVLMVTLGVMSFTPWGTISAGVGGMGVSVGVVAGLVLGERRLRRRSPCSDDPGLPDPTFHPR